MAYVRGEARFGGMTAGLRGGLVAAALIVGAAQTAWAEARSVSEPLKTPLEARAAMFVIDQFLNDENDLEAIKAFYGESVFYFREGAQSRAEVLADKKAYLERWPRRRFEPDLGTLRTRLIKGPDGRSDVEVSLEVDFEVSGAPRRDLRRRDGLGFSGDEAPSRADRAARSRRVSRGRSIVVIVLARRADDFIVLSEGGKVIDRR